MKSFLKLKHLLLLLLVVIIGGTFVYAEPAATDTKIFGDKVAEKTLTFKAPNSMEQFVKALDVYFRVEAKTKNMTMDGRKLDHFGIKLDTEKFDFVKLVDEVNLLDAGFYPYYTVELTYYKAGTVQFSNRIYLRRDEVVDAMQSDKYINLLHFDFDKMKMTFYGQTLEQAQGKLNYPVEVITPQALMELMPTILPGKSYLEYGSRWNKGGAYIPLNWHRSTLVHPVSPAVPMGEIYDTQGQRIFMPRTPMTVPADNKVNFDLSKVTDTSPRILVLFNNDIVEKVYLCVAPSKAGIDYLEDPRIGVILSAVDSAAFKLGSSKLLIQKSYDYSKNSVGPFTLNLQPFTKSGVKSFQGTWTWTSKAAELLKAAKVVKDKEAFAYVLAIEVLEGKKTIFTKRQLILGYEIYNFPAHTIKFETSTNQVTKFNVSLYAVKEDQTGTVLGLK